MILLICSRWARLLQWLLMSSLQPLHEGTNFEQGETWRAASCCMDGGNVAAWQLVELGLNGLCERLFKGCLRTF